MPIRDEAINIFMGVPGEELPELEPTHNYGVDDYELGTATAMWRSRSRIWTSLSIVSGSWG